MDSVKEPGELFRKHLDSLMRILYGLAIASGVVTAFADVKDMLGKDSAFYSRSVDIGLYSYMPFVIATLFLAVADWVHLHVILVKCPYDKKDRILIDIAFPIGIFCMFNVPVLANWGVLIYALLLAGYFLLTIWYISLLKGKWEQPSVFRWFLPAAAAVVFAAALLGLAVFFMRDQDSCIAAWDAILRKWCIPAISLVVSAVYAWILFGKVDEMLEQCSPDTERKNSVQWVKTAWVLICACALYIFARRDVKKEKQNTKVR
jgi:hypothetical protein